MVRSSKITLSLLLLLSPFSAVAYDKPNDRPEPGLLGLHTQLKSKKQKFEENQEAIFTPSQWKFAKFFVGMLGTAGVHFLADYIVGNGKGVNFYNGQYARGFAQTLQLSGVCIAISPMLNEEWSDMLFKLGVRAPMVAATAILAVHPNTQKLVSHIPLGLGQYLSTYEVKKVNGNKEYVNKCGDDCGGICARCFIPKVVITVAFYKNMIDPFVDKIGGAIGRKLGFIKEEKQTT